MASQSETFEIRFDGSDDEAAGYLRDSGTGRVLVICRPGTGNQLKNLDREPVEWREDGTLAVGREEGPYVKPVVFSAATAKTIAAELEALPAYEAPAPHPDQAEIDRRVQSHNETRRRDERSSGNYGPIN